MKLDLINMSKVPTAETVGESDKVLIESGGEIKKTAASNIGGGGGGSKVEFVSPDSKTLALNKTWAEIFALVKGGTLVCMVHSGEESCSMYIVSEVVTYEDQGSTVYRVSFDDLANQSGMDAIAESADGYPIVND